MSIKAMLITAWSFRFEPTPGKSATSGIPNDERSEAGPTPDNCKI